MSAHIASDDHESFGIRALLVLCIAGASLVCGEAGVWIGSVFAHAIHQEILRIWSRATCLS